jgi:ribosome maturation factor RimP
VSNSNLDTIEPMLETMCESHGLELVLVSLEQDRDGRVLRVLIDRPGAAEATEPGHGIGVEDCAKVSRDLSAALDEDENLVTGKFRLEVGSPGVERPLVKLRDFARFVGREAKIKTQAKVSNRRIFHGELLGVDGEQVRLLDEHGEVAIPMESIVKANLVSRL